MSSPTLSVLVLVALSRRFTPPVYHLAAPFGMVRIADSQVESIEK